MQLTPGETWRFRVRCRGAERVYLVREPDIGPSAWIEMTPVDEDRWEVRHHLGPGTYRFRYFRANGETFLNCGDHGLTGERLSQPDPTVQVDQFRCAIPA